MFIDRPGRTTSWFGCNNNNFDPLVDDEGVDGPVENQCRASPTALFGNPTPNNPFSVFDGQYLAATWQLTITDAAAQDTGVLQQWCLIPALEDPAISLEKTVGTDPAVCATSNDVSVPYGSNVTYCYRVTNTGNVTLTTHSLQDDQLGALLSNFSYALVPGASAFITESATLTQTTINQADWTAANGVYSVTAGAQATVTVGAAPSLHVQPASLASQQDLNLVRAQTLTISNTGGSELHWTLTEHAGASCAAPVGLSWVSATVVSGTLTPGSQTTITVNFDSTGLASGAAYTGTVCLNSNDPAQPQTPVSLVLKVLHRVYLSIIMR